MSAFKILLGNVNVAPLTRDIVLGSSADFALVTTLAFQMLSLKARGTRSCEVKGMKFDHQLHCYVGFFFQNLNLLLKEHEWDAYVSIKCNDDLIDKNKFLRKQMEFF